MGRSYSCFVRGLDLRKDHNICDLHSAIKEIAEELERMEEGDFEDVRSGIKIVEGSCSDILALIDAALNAGQRMEERLREYREAIEDLGFERKK